MEIIAPTQVSVTGRLIETGGSYVNAGGNSDGSTYIQDGGSILVQGGRFGSGSLTVAAEGTGTFTQTGGSVNMGDTVPYSSNGNITIKTGGVYHMSGGTLEGVAVPEVGQLSLDGGSFIYDGGTASIQTITNDGELSLNAKAAPGQFVVSNFSTTGTLNINDLSPLVSPLLSPTSATLGETLSIELDPSYMPQMGDTFLLIQATKLTGTFSDYDFPDLPGNLYFQPDYTATSFSLQIVPEPSAVGIAISAIWYSGLLKRRKR